MDKFFPDESFRFFDRDVLDERQSDLRRKIDELSQDQLRSIERLRDLDSFFNRIKDLDRLERERLFNRVRSGAKLVGKQNLASTRVQKERNSQTYSVSDSPILNAT